MLATGLKKKNPYRSLAVRGSSVEYSAKPNKEITS
jgi:hypothetical protein